MNRESLHKSLQWELGLLTCCLQAEKKKTGIQLIRVTDANGNTYERYYDFDKGEFAKNPGGEMPPEDLKKYRGLRNKDIKDSIASENYLYTEISDEDGEAIWKAMEGQIEGLNPEQTAETKAVLQHLTITNNGWKGGMKILGDQVSLGFEDGLKSIQSNVDRGLSAVGAGLNTLWQGLNQKPVKDGILLAGALIGSVASAVKGYSILGGGLEGLVTKSLLTGFGLEFTALALGSFFVGQAIKMLVLPAIAEYRKNHPPLTESQKASIRSQNAMKGIEDNKRKNILNAIKTDSKDLGKAINSIDNFIEGLAFSQIHDAEEYSARVERGNARSEGKKYDLSGFNKFNPFAVGTNMGLNNATSILNAISKRRNTQAYEILAYKVGTREELTKDVAQVESLASQLNEVEKNLNEHEATLNSVDYDKIYNKPDQADKKQRAEAQRTKTLENINQMKEAIVSKRVELYASMFTESELIREYDNQRNTLLLKLGHSYLNGVQANLWKAKHDLLQAKATEAGKLILEQGISIPSVDYRRKELGVAYSKPANIEEAMSQYKNSMRHYENLIQRREEIRRQIANTTEEQQQLKEKRRKIQDKNEGMKISYQIATYEVNIEEYNKRLTETKSLLQSFEQIKNIDYQIQSLPEIKELQKKVDELTKANEESLHNLNKISLTYKQKLETLIGNEKATSEENKEVAQETQEASSR